MAHASSKTDRPAKRPKTNLPAPGSLPKLPDSIFYIENQPRPGKVKPKRWRRAA